MEHRIGTVSLIRWQAPRNRRSAPGKVAWTVLMAVCALAASATLAAQAMGALPWWGPLSVLPAALLALSLAAQILAVGKAVVAWLVG